MLGRRSFIASLSALLVWWKTTPAEKTFRELYWDRRPAPVNQAAFDALRAELRNINAQYRRELTARYYGCATDSAREHALDSRAQRKDHAHSLRING